MKTKRRGALEWLRWFLFLAVILWGINPLQAQQIGKTIDKSNVQEFKDLLIPVLYRAVERGDWILKTGNLGFPYKLADAFLASSEKNEGKYSLNKDRWIVDKGAGKIPKNVYGMPFPKIDKEDPAVADKIIWNYTFMKYRFMGTICGSTGAIWVSEKGEERSNGGYAYNLYYQGRPPGQEIKVNPENFSVGEILDVRYPMSLKGTNNLSWDYFEPGREITVFSYVPAIRRIRQTSGASRSDPYMGSDSWLDLNFMWAGKHTAMKWKLVGERTILVPFSSTAKHIAEEAPDGTVTSVTLPVMCNYNTPGWKVGNGAAWAAPNLTWIPRKVWVVEQWPQDPFYNWGLHINYVDKETFVIWVKEVYNKAGEFRTWRQMVVHYSESPSGKNNVMDFDISPTIDEKARHCTISHRAKPGGENLSYLYLPESRLGPKWFTLAKMLELSK